MRPEATLSYLFVDEDPLQISALRRLSRGLPGIQLSATTGEEALRLAEAARPSAVISSYQLPDMDGLTLLETLRARLPGVACALHTFLPPHHFPQGGPIVLLEKPCPAETLMAFLHSASEREG